MKFAADVFNVDVKMEEHLTINDANWLIIFYLKAKTKNMKM